MRRSAVRAFDVAVIGGGVIGSAIAWGLARAGMRVGVLDEGDSAYRASRGAAGLIWVQGKGAEAAHYGAWTVNSSNSWPAFADALKTETGLGVGYRRPGGFHLALCERELELRAGLRRQLCAQGRPLYDFEILDHARVSEFLPNIGRAVVGASYCSLDGQVNPLRLLQALHIGMQRLKASYLPDHRVERIAFRGGEFRVATRSREIRAGKVVVAAGLGSERLAPMIGLQAAVRPQRGQILMTERTSPFLVHPVAGVCQTDEGGVMVGETQEEVGFNVDVTTTAVGAIADRAVRTFPPLARLGVVRCWAALRVMTPDGLPIYDESPVYPGAFLVVGHSGITLAAGYALTLSRAIASGHLPEKLSAYSGQRFHVQATAGGLGTKGPPIH